MPPSFLVLWCVQLLKQADQRAPSDQFPPIFQEPGGQRGAIGHQQSLPQDQLKTQLA